MSKGTEKRFLGTATAVASAAALLLAVGVASAAEVDGKIRSLDKSSRILTLANGVSFQLAQNVKIQMLKPGQQVRVSFEVDGKKRIADKVTVAN